MIAQFPRTGGSMTMLDAPIWSPLSLTVELSEAQHRRCRGAQRHGNDLNQRRQLAIRWIDLLAKNL
jgi:hypothetical protein